MPWQLTESSARGSMGMGLFEAFPSSPKQAAQLQIDPQNAVLWHIAGVKPIPSHNCLPQEIYCREEDLICRYSQSERDLFSFQLDWRLLPAVGPFTLGVELWLSVQTDLLDTRPELEVTSQAIGSQSWRLLTHEELRAEPLPGNQPCRGPAVMICRGIGSDREPMSGLWLIEPSDQTHGRVTSEPADLNLSVRMFGHFMEKGVIRRGRMQFLLSSSDVSDSDIAHAYQLFATSPLPLTA